MIEDLVQWFGEQLDEDERIARAAEAAYGSVWTADEQLESVSSDTGADVVEEPNAPHAYIAAHDPARVLREIDAKRRIAELHDYYRSESLGNAPACFLCGPGLGWPCPTMRSLALPYADRPDYREEWRP